MPLYQTVSTMITIILGAIAFGSLTMGYFLCPTRVIEWVISATATLLLFFPGLVQWISNIDVPIIIIDGIGIGLWVVVYFMQKIRIRKDSTLTLPIHERRQLKKAEAAAV
jgi:hypothetical protein